MSNQTELSPLSPLSPPSPGSKRLSKDKLFSINKYKCKLVESHAGRMPGSEVEQPIMNVQFIEQVPDTDIDNTYLFAPVTDSIADKIANSGYELENGDIILLMPKPSSFKKVNWLSVY